MQLDKEELNETKNKDKTIEMVTLVPDKTS